MRKSVRGFTIVELLIVIVVIAILAAITIVAYNGVQRRALATAKLTEIEAWQRQILLYYAANGEPVDATLGQSYCLGSGFPNGKCRSYQGSGSTTYYEADNATLMADLKSATGSLPTGDRTPVGPYVGPYVYFWSGGEGFTLFTYFNGGASDCPSPMVYNWDDGAGTLKCEQDVSYT